MNRVVIWDPTREAKQGELIDGELRVRKAIRLGAVLLPVDPDFCCWGVDGWAFRSWGTGWRFDTQQGHRGCATVMRVENVRPFIYWAAMLRPANPELSMQGLLKLTADTSRGDLGAGFGVEAPARRVEECEPRTSGRVVVGGRLRLSSAGNGYMGLSLYGIAANVLVEWTAVSQSAEQADMATLFG